MPNKEWNDRIEHWVRTLTEDFYEPLGEIPLEAFRTMEQLTIEEAKQKPYLPVQQGYIWGEKWEYCWFRGSFSLPEEGEGRRIVLNLNPGGESSLYVNGQEFGTYRADWIACPHHYMVDNTVTREGKRGEQFELYLETYAGHYFPNHSYCATGPVLPGSYEDPAVEGSRRTMGSCTFGIWREEAYQLYMDVCTLGQLLSVTDPDTLRASKLMEALKEFTRVVDFEQEAKERLHSYAMARKALRKALEAENGSTTPLFWAIGNAHIDLAWLWPVAETERKTLRTFAAQLRLLEEYPDYRFIQSQPAAYEMCRERHPKLFAQILEAIGEGRWIADGAMWVEPDTNMVGGEALIRQLVYGKRYYKEVLGVDSRVLWLPDTFGYTAALPQILLGCDVPYLVTQKIFWTCNDGEQFPYHYFYWEGMDGSKVTSFLPTSYTYQTDPKELVSVWKSRAQREDLEAFLLPYGYGDGGGGPARDHLEYIEREKNLEGCPKVTTGSVEDFFKYMEAEGGPRHTYAGELYFSNHRGTYTSQAMIKKQNRRSELALRELELWYSLGGLWGLSYPREEAERLWKILLFHQFHDILPGSSIERVYTEANEAHTALQKRSEELTEEALSYLSKALRESKGFAMEQTEEIKEEIKEGEAVTLWNSFPFARTALVELSKTFAFGAITPEGERLPVQSMGDEVKALVTIPACGAVSLLPAKENKGEPKVVSVWPVEGGFCMENEYLRVCIDQNGGVNSFLQKESGREIADGVMNVFHLYKDVPRHFDAWDLDSNYREMEQKDAWKVQSVTIVREGLEGVLKVEGRIGDSACIQYIRLKAGHKRLEFETRIHWQELHRLLKVSFPVRVYVLEARHEMQFGYVKRPNHRSRAYDKERFEVCNHRYTALCEESHGAALLNDCKYGVGVEKNAIELTLLRAPASPQMRADNGWHTFTYALYAWEGSFLESGLVQEGYELNVAPICTKGQIPLFEGFHVDKKNIIMETIKPAEDGSKDIILRLYEAAGASVTTNVRLPARIKEVWTCNMLEEQEHSLTGLWDNQIRLSFRAFEIKTIRLRPYCAENPGGLLT